MTISSIRASLIQASSFVFMILTSACASPDGQVTTTMTDDEIRAAPHARVCATAAPGEAACHARVLVDVAGTPVPNATPAGYGPSQLRDAYKITSSGSSSTTIAIVDAFGYPNAETDLATYRSTFGLPPCTTANGCFRKVDQRGGTRFPRANVGWEQETALDLDMASAICPSCRLLLVEADTNSFASLAAAVNTAATLGAKVISNSYGGGESGSAGVEPAYNHAGIAITASSGDSGFGVEFPASSPHVWAVGGTSLRTAANTRGWTETAWSGAGSGCSTVYQKPSWQTDTGCAKRTVADTSAIADPNTGVAVFAPSSSGTSTFLVFGGTSVAAPLIAGVFGAAGTITPNPDDPNEPPVWSHACGPSLFDVTAGTNGSCSPGYLCTAGTGYDGPTGLGTPNGTAAF